MLPLQNPQHQNLLTFALVIFLVGAFIFSLRSTAHNSAVAIVIWVTAWILFCLAAFSFINGMDGLAVVFIAAWGALLVFRELTQKEVGRPEI